MQSLAYSVIHKSTKLQLLYNDIILHFCRKICLPPADATTNYRPRQIESRVANYL